MKADEYNTTLTKFKNGRMKMVLHFLKQKLYVCIFGNLRKLHHEPTLTIPVVQEHEFIGVIFDNKLSFIPHIKYLKARCLKALHLLKVVSRFDWGAASIVLLCLYIALVRSRQAP